MLQRKANSDWSHYVPRKLKEPVSKKLRPTVQNPLNSVKAECYAMKLEYLKGEVKAQKQNYEMALRREEKEHEMAQRREERELERHAMEMRKLALEIKKLENGN